MLVYFAVAVSYKLKFFNTSLKGKASMLAYIAVAKSYKLKMFKTQAHMWPMLKNFFCQNLWRNQASMLIILYTNLHKSILSQQSKVWHCLGRIHISQHFIFFATYLTSRPNKLAFFSGRLFQPSLMFVGKAGTYQSEICSTIGQASGLTSKHQTRLEKPFRNKHSSLFVNYEENKVL